MRGYFKQIMSIQFKSLIVLLHDLMYLKSQHGVHKLVAHWEHIKRKPRTCAIILSQVFILRR